MRGYGNRLSLLPELVELWPFYYLVWIAGAYLGGGMALSPPRLRRKTGRFKWMVLTRPVAHGWGWQAGGVALRPGQNWHEGGSRRLLCVCGAVLHRAFRPWTLLRLPFTPTTSQAVLVCYRVVLLSRSLRAGAWVTHAGRTQHVMVHVLVLFPAAEHRLDLVRRGEAGGTVSMGIGLCHGCHVGAQGPPHRGSSALA